MIEIERLAPGALALTVRDRLTRGDFSGIEMALEREKNAAEQLCLLVDIREMRSMETEALIADLRYSFEQIGKLSSWKRLALISENSVMSSLARMQARFVSNPRLRVFGGDERDAARRFTIEGEEPTRSPEAESARGESAMTGIARIETNRPDAIAFSITSRVSPQDAQAARTIVEEAAQHHGKIDLLVRLDGWQGFDLGILARPDSWTSGSAIFRSLRRYAVVGAPQAMQGASDFLGAFMPFEVRTFPLDREADGWRFIDAEPAEESVIPMGDGTTGPGS